ncbi:hypothetical protein B0J13DRAFT_650756 [Dactylonectria estremocensis]|uniref:DUF676 domain-containing protein n=1 Tax=Dactylonectria estremocensis TaxID=1079267 RepID=A0A9P9FCC0_9HYPO|nr:hypothetical protein B0J13DRAFT_650756 [Dactylonectria estremocensis]
MRDFLKNLEDIALHAVGIAKQGVGAVVGDAINVASAAANAAEHLAKIAGHLTTIAGDATGAAIIAGKALGTQGAANIFKQWADKDVVLKTAKDILEGGSENASRGLVKAAKSRALSLVTEDELLKDAADIFQEANDEAIRNTVFAITRRTFWAMRPYLGKAPAIYEGVLSNAANWDTLQYILSNWSLLAEFLIDLVEPAKLYAMGNSGDDKPNKDEMNRNKYNELDLNKPMNKHAVICQLQRLAKSLVIVLKKDRQGEGLDRFKMDTKLDTDDEDVESTKQGYDFEGRETWFFVNGIAGEPYWLSLACDKLEDTFKRKVQGVFNRSEGILWDLIECAGERDSDGGSKGRIRGLIKRTKSSLQAQCRLKKLLVAVLAKNEQSKIIVIAHSQGCLILRLVLEQLAEEASQTVLRNMRKRLQVFTFGNPSIAWAVHKDCDHTEHFANEKDFVAQLGVLRHSNDYQGRIFINKTWTGHLFGSQYSLKAEDYGINKEDSKLFACAGNTPTPDRV